MQTLTFRFPTPTPVQQIRDWNNIQRLSQPVSVILEACAGLFDRGPRFTNKPYVSAAALGAIFSGI